MLDRTAKDAKVAKHCWSLTAAVLLVPCALTAQVPAARDSLADSAARRIAPVTVRATRAPAVVGGAGAIVAPIDSLALPPAPSLEEGLRALPFVLVRRNSRGEAELSVRGSDSRQAAVLVDGVPMTLGWDHRSDPSLLPLAGAGSITLVRGLSSLLHGPNVLGGVIEVDLAAAAPAETSPRIAMAIEGGSAGGRRGSLVASDRVLRGGRLSLRAGASRREAEGVPLAEDVADPTASGGLRTNSDASATEGFGAARYDGAGWWLGATGAAYRAERGVAPELHVAEPRRWRYPEQRRALGILSFGAGALRGSVGLNAGRTEIAEYATSAYDVVSGRETGDERTATARLTSTLAVPLGGQLAVAATAARVQYDERIDDDPAQRYEQRLWSLGGEGSWTPRATTTLVAGAALDGASTPRTGDKPALGARIAPGVRVGLTSVGAHGTRWHLAASRRSRFPALRELYSGALGRFEPNPDLRAERLTAAEAGVTRSAGALEVQATAFHHRLSDAVVRTSTSDGRFRRENLPGVRTTGLELFAAAYGSRASLQGDATLQHMQLAGAADDGPRHAEHQPSLRLGAEARVELPAKLRGMAGLRYTGRQYCVHADAGREVRLAGAARVDAGVDRAIAIRSGPWRRVRGWLRMENLADAAVYDQCGLPQPGRTVRVGMAVE